MKMGFDAAAGQMDQQGSGQHLCGGDDVTGQRHGRTRPGPNIRGKPDNGSAPIKGGPKHEGCVVPCGTHSVHEEGQKADAISGNLAIEIREGL